MSEDISEMCGVFVCVCVRFMKGYVCGCGSGCILLYVRVCVSLGYMCVCVGVCIYIVWVSVFGHGMCGCLSECVHACVSQRMYLCVCGCTACLRVSSIA